MLYVVPGLRTVHVGNFFLSWVHGCGVLAI